jgi:hypothetical protein
LRCQMLFISIPCWHFHATWFLLHFSLICICIVCSHKVIIVVLYVLDHFIKSCIILITQMRLCTKHYTTKELSCDLKICNTMTTYTLYTYIPCILAVLNAKCPLPIPKCKACNSQLPYTHYPILNPSYSKNYLLVTFNFSTLNYLHNLPNSLSRVYSFIWY